MAGGLTHNRKCALVVQNGQVSGSGDHTNFPVLLTLDTLPSEMFDADGSYPAQNGGGDIRFTSDSAGTTLLDAEIVSFVTDNTPANGSAEIWVRIPTLDYNDDTTFYVWYNTSGSDSQPAASASGGSEGVWQTSIFDSVLHFEDNVNDSTANSNDGSLAGTPAYVAGDFGDAIELDASGERVDVPAVDNNGEACYEVWAYVNTLSVNSDISSFSESPPSDPVHDRDIIVGTDGRVYCEIYDGATKNWNTTNAEVSATTWCQIALAYTDSSNASIYVDGAVATGGTQSVNTVYQGYTTPEIMYGYSHSDVGQNNADILIDEAVCYAVEPSADWLATRYNNLSSPSTFIVEGTPEAAAGASITPQAMNHYINMMNG